jgi:SAM-dependent methyltransferase
VSCVCCGATEHQLLYHLRDISFGEEGAWKFVSCGSCGHGFINPLPSDSELQCFYEALYTKEKREEMIKMGKGSFDQALQRRRARLLFNHSKTSVHRILDVGCGMGFSLGKLKEQWPDAEAIGLELSPVAAEEAAKNEGLHILNTTIWELEIENGSVDVVTMNHLLEHLQDPKKELQKVHQLLTKEGLLLVEVPHLEGWGRRWFGAWWWGHLPPQHLHLFRPQGLIELIQQAGFVLEEKEQHGYPLTLFLTLVVYIRGTFGGYSPFRDNVLIRAVGFFLGLLLLPFVFLGDLLLTPFLNRKQGDIVTLVLRKV